MAWASCYSPDFQALSIVGAASGTTASNDRRLVEAVNGAVFSFQSGSIDTGRVAIRHSDGVTTTAQNHVLSTMVATSRYAGVMFRFKPVSISLDTMIVKLTSATTTDQVIVKFTTAGVLQYSTNNAGAYTNVGKTLTAGTVYRIEVFVDWGTTTAKTIKIRVDGVELVNASWTGTSGSTSNGLVQIGTSQTAAGNPVDFSDEVTYNDVAQYGLLNDWRVFQLTPATDGTHSVTVSGNFKDNASASLSNATTTSHNLVDEYPPTVTDFVQQTAIAANDYMEHVMTTIPDGWGTPVLMSIVGAFHPVAAATANTCTIRINVAGSVSTEAVVDTSVASNTLEYRRHHYTTRPGGTAFSATDGKTGSEIRTRFGYSNDATPPPALDSIAVWVVVGPIVPPVATGSGSVPTPVILSTHDQVPVASGVGSAPVPTLVTGGGATTVTSPVASGSGSVPTPVVLAALDSVPVASGVGQALAPTLKANVVPPVAAGQGQAIAPSLSALLAAPVATGQGAALVPMLAALLAAPVASGSGRAYAPTTFASGDTPPVAAGSGRAFSPALSAVLLPGVASGSGQAPTPVLAALTAPSVAAGQGQALAPLILASVLPGVARGNGQAIAPALSAIILAPVASGVGEAPTPSLVAAALLSVPAPATGAGQAFAPTLSAVLHPDVAMGNGQAVAPLLASVVQPAASTGNGQAFVPTIAAIIQPDVATGSGDAPTPAIQYIVAPSVASGQGMAPAPSIAWVILPPVATGEGEAPTPLLVLPIIVQAPAARGSGSAPAPLLVVRELPNVPTGQGTAYAPQLAAIVHPPVAYGSGMAPAPSLPIVQHPPVATGHGEAYVPHLVQLLSALPALGEGDAPDPILTVVLFPPVATGRGGAPDPRLPLIIRGRVGGTPRWTRLLPGGRERRLLG